MELNADFTKRAIVHGQKTEWVASPMKGVDRRMLDRIGDEVARATTIVRYAPGSAFSAHTHTGGEEFLVLEGVFTDEHGDYPAGTYVRNPMGTSHTPSSAPGTTIFVKLWQFDQSDQKQFSVDTDSGEYQETAPGIDTLLLHEDSRERVTMERWSANADVALTAPDGMEILVVKGGFTEDGEDFVSQSWLRIPRGGEVSAKVGPEGAQVWVKRNHLAQDIKAPG